MSIDLALRMKQARIPFIVQKKKLADFDGQVIETYMLSKQYNEDRTNGIGAVIIGADPRGEELLQVMARAAVVASDYVAYTSLQTLVYAVTGDEHPAFELFESCHALYVGGFHDEGEPLPISIAERFAVEGFLKTRVESGLRNYYVASRFFDVTPSWWTKKFIAHQKKYLRELHV